MSATGPDGPGRGAPGEPRRATAADLPELAGLVRAFHSFHVAGVPDRLREPDPDQDQPERLDGALRAILDDPAALLLVHDQAGGSLDAFAEAYVREVPAGAFVPAQRFGLLQSLYVAEAARGRGIGRVLVAAVETWLTDQGIGEIRTDTWELEAGPLGFYEALGYRTARRELTRMLVTTKPTSGTLRPHGAGGPGQGSASGA